MLKVSTELLAMEKLNVEQNSLYISLVPDSALAERSLRGEEH